MSTPQPPFTAPIDPTAQPSQPGLSQAARFINVFIAPKKTFSDIRRSASWWVPWLVFSLFFTGFTFTVSKKIGYDAVVNSMVAHSSLLQRATDSMTPEQKQVFLAKQIASQERGVYTGWITTLVIVLIVAGLFLLTFNFGFDAQMKYKHALAVVFYAWLPKIISLALAILVMSLGVEPEGFDVENPVATHLGVILGFNTDHRYLYHLLSSFDVFSIWLVILLGIGFATVSARKISTTTAIVVAAVWWFTFDLIRVAATSVLG